MRKYIIDIDEKNICLDDNGSQLAISVKVNDASAIFCTEIPLTPYTEPDMEQVRKEAWEAARKIAVNADHGGLSAEALREIFSVGTASIAYIFDNFSASEAIEKIRQYEESKEKHTWICSEVNEPSVDTTLICSECGYTMKMRIGDTPALNFCPKCGDCKKPKEEETGGNMKCELCGFVDHSTIYASNPPVYKCEKYGCIVRMDSTCKGEINDRKARAGKSVTVANSADRNSGTAAT